MTVWIRCLPRFPTTFVFEKRRDPRQTHVHVRGQYLRRGKEVSPGVPATLYPLPEGAPRDRLTFAKRLVDKRNPLVGRVIVNQLCQSHFGRGNRPEKFGVQGRRPTYRGANREGGS